MTKICELGRGAAATQERRSGRKSMETMLLFLPIVQGLGIRSRNAAPRGRVRRAPPTPTHGVEPGVALLPRRAGSGLLRRLSVRGRVCGGRRRRRLTKTAGGDAADTFLQGRGTIRRHGKFRIRTDTWFQLGRKIRQVLPTLLYVDAAGGKVKKSAPPLCHICR